MRMPVNNTRAARKPMRQKSVGGSRVSVTSPVPAPVGGWDAVSPLAHMPPDRAVVLDNWFPQPGYIEVRRGYIPYCIGASDGPIESLMVYNATTVLASRLFAGAGDSIYDVTNLGTAVSSATGFTNARWQYTNFATAGGHFLVCVNGQDDPQNYDGTNWTAPTITGTGITPSNFINVNAHKNRLWFIIRDSMDAAYLPTNSISGTAAKFPLGSVCGKGGYLVAMTTWTHDGGNGPDDYAVFITSRGQVAVYQGDDPSSSSSWALVGVYDMGPPIGYRCFTKVAGDVALLNIDGVLPLSRALTTDRGAAVGIAITGNINNAMNAAAQSYKDNFGWELTPFAKGTAAILNVPIAELSSANQYVMNTLTGAWCRFTGWDANCFAVFNDTLYFGGNDGIVNQAWTGSADNEDEIDAIGQTSYQYFNGAGRLKQFKMIQPLLTTSVTSRPSIGISTDFKDNAVQGVPTAAASGGAVYGTAVYDSAVYAAELETFTDWTSVTGLGYSASVHFRALTSLGEDNALWDRALWDSSALWSSGGGSTDVTMRINAFNIIMESGEFL